MLGRPQPRYSHIWPWTKRTRVPRLTRIDPAEYGFKVTIGLAARTADQTHIGYRSAMMLRQPIMLLSKTFLSVRVGERYLRAMMPVLRFRFCGTLAG
jgi:hypothetical protein